MSHLKCLRHGRRTVVINGKAFHRNNTPGPKNGLCDAFGVLSGARAYKLDSKSFTKSEFVKVVSE